MDPYQCDDAETIFIGLGTVVGTLKEWVDVKRGQGEKVGALKLRCFRPFPLEELREALGNAKRVVVVEKAVGVGAYGIVAAEVRAALYGQASMPPVTCAMAGLGGRDITFETFEEMLKRAQAGESDLFAGMRAELLEAS